MATIEMFLACEKRNRKIKRITTKESGYFPNLRIIFGEVKLVNQINLANLSKREKRRHLYEDKVLWFLYIEN